MAGTQRYYVRRSSWFDSHRYDTPKIKRAVARAGGTNIRTANAYGWSNQPQVVTFSGNNAVAQRVAAEVGKALGTQWIIVSRKDW